MNTWADAVLLLSSVFVLCGSLSIPGSLFLVLYQKRCEDVIRDAIFKPNKQGNKELAYYGQQKIGPQKPATSTGDMQKARKSGSFPSVDGTDIRSFVEKIPPGDHMARQCSFGNEQVPKWEGFSQVLNAEYLCYYLRKVYQFSFKKM